MEPIFEVGTKVVTVTRYGFNRDQVTIDVGTVTPGGNSQFINVGGWETHRNWVMALSELPALVERHGVFCLTQDAMAAFHTVGKQYPPSYFNKKEVTA